ncbi:MAG: HTH domain-containing protein [Halovenus sp.]
MRQEVHQKHAETALDSWWEGYRERLSEGGSHRVETFIRSRTPTAGTHSRRTRLFRTLERATNANRIERYDVTLLGEKLCLCDYCRAFHDDTALLDTVERLGSWRDGEIYSTGFTERETESSITGERYSDVVPPEIALGIYVDDSLAGVFPCTAAGVDFRPEAYLDGLAAGRLAGIGD